jgi:hypothetical protein
MYVPTTCSWNERMVLRSSLSVLLPLVLIGTRRRRSVPPSSDDRDSGRRTGPGEARQEHWHPMVPAGCTIWNLCSDTQSPEPLLPRNGFVQQPVAADIASRNC